MKKILLLSLFASIIGFNQSVQAQAHMAGIDGPAAVKDQTALAIGNILLSNYDLDNVTCDGDEDLVKSVLSAANNKKILAAAKKKDAAALLKQLGLSRPSPSFFSSAVKLALESYCGDEDDGGDDDSGDAEFEKN